MTVFLTGPLGAGKTTFLQGFAEALGVEGFLTSPTYALEQRYQTAHWGELLHVDLYRLSERDARKLVDQSEEHGGIRCIEWAERLGADRPSSLSIRIAFEEAQNGRELHCTYDDIPLPSRADVDRWRDEACLPPHIRAHCDTVAELSTALGEILLKRGLLLRPLALRRAAELHDLLRFLDFRPGAHPSGPTGSQQEETVWKTWRERFPGLRHEAACAALLRERGYEALASIVEVHGFALPPPERCTIEQKILFYADKRVIIDKITTLEERFADFARRYGKGTETERNRSWYAEVKRVEKELFPSGLPDFGNGFPLTIRDTTARAAERESSGSSRERHRE